MARTSNRSLLSFKLVAASFLVLCSQRMTRVLFSLHENESRRMEEILIATQSNEKQDHRRDMSSPDLPVLKETNVAKDERTTTADNTQSSKPRRQRQRNRQRKKRRNQITVPPPKLKVPLPIFVPSLPKSGTTSIHKYFLCGKQSSAHLVYHVDGRVKNKIGRCWQGNIRKGKNPLDGCGDHDIWSDTGYVDMNYRKGQSKSRAATNIPCYYPLIEALDEVYEAYPNSTFLFVTRNETSWLNSIATYHDGFIMDVWKRCRTEGFPGMDATLEDFLEFYRWHQQLIRSFAKHHPSITYIEVPLEAASTAQVLEDRIGISQECWGHYNQQSVIPAIK